MKWISTIIIILILSTVSFAQVIGPKISTIETKYNFGDIIEGAIVSHEFMISNSGDDALRITNVRASCGCTAAKPEKNKLNPGEATSIKVDFNSAGRKGLQKKYVYVFSNDIDQPRLRLEFSANIIPRSEKDAALKNAPRIVLSKTQHNFGSVKEGSIVELDIIVKNNGMSNLEIGDIKTSCGCTAVLLRKKTLGPGMSGDLKIELDTSNRNGTITRTVTINSNDPVNPKMTVTLMINIVGEKT